MFDSQRRWLTARLKRSRQPHPLVSSSADLRLVQHVRGNLAPRFPQLRRMGKILSPKERLLVRVSVVVALVSCVWLAAILANRHRVIVPAVGGRYVEGMVGVPELVNPIFSSLSDVDTELARLIYSGLMRYDEKGRLVPDIAATVAVSDDKKIYTLTLDQDVVWHDGEPLTAQDVAFTIETIQNPLVGSPLLPAFQGVEVNVLDDYKVEFKLKEPFTPFLSSLTVGILPEHIWGSVSDERIRIHKNNLQPIGSGPYKFSKLFKDDTGYIYRYELVRNDRYHRLGPYIAEFAVQFFGDYEGLNGVIQALREQKIDGLSFVPHDLREKVERKHIILHTVPLPQYTALFFNQDRNSTLKDGQVRKALELALDKNRMVREAVRGEGRVIGSPMLSSFPEFQASSTPVQYSLEEANKLLDARSNRISAVDYRALRRDALLSEIAGTSSTTAPVSTSTLAALEAQLDKEIAPAQTFYRKDKAGALLALTLVTVDTPEYKQVAELAAGFWQEAGVKTTVELVPAKDFSREVLRGRSYDVLLYGLIVGYDPDQFPFWHSSQIDFPGLNLSRYVNASVDTWLKQARGAADPKEAVELYRKIETAILSDRPAIFLYTPTYTYATADRVYGIVDAPVYHPADRFNAVTNWYVKTKSQWSLE